MPVIPNLYDPIVETSAVSLLEYAQFVGYGECALFGVRPPVGYEENDFCSNIWMKGERDHLTRFLAAAQEDLESILGYPIGERWIEGERHSLITSTIVTGWGKVTAVGKRASTLIEAGVMVDWTNIHLADIVVPYVGDPPATQDEVYVYHAGTTFEITPSSIAVGGGQIVIRVPRCRMVRPEFADNPEDGWKYEDGTKFADSVDVWRVYTDTNHGVYQCRNGCGCTTALTPINAFLQIEDGEVGELISRPADCSTNCCSHATLVANYKAGRPTSVREREVVIRFAHSKMPAPPCGCDGLKNTWAADKEPPESRVFTGMRLNNPFGLSKAAWDAYAWAHSNKLVRGIPTYG